MQQALIIQSNGAGSRELESLLEKGHTVVSVTPNNSTSYNDFLVILEDPQQAPQALETSHTPHQEGESPA